MFRWINLLRIACIVFALLILCSGIIAVALGRPAPLSFGMRLALALPLLAIFNIATTYIKKKTLAAQVPETAVEPKP